MRWLLLLVAVLGLHTNAGAQVISPAATADLRSAAGEQIATATFTQAPGEVRIAVAFPNRTALVGTHAISIHGGARCNPPGPVLQALPNLVISPAGVSIYNLSAPQATVSSLLGGSGSALVIFAQTDGSAPVACGRIVATTTSAAELVPTALIALMGGLLIAAGVVLRRHA